jgi:2-keto-4-pentenoate hydratase/2-oxohepta-3-ene-1,7-dioic acid hydratase in catechol pathway
LRAAVDAGLQLGRRALGRGGHLNAAVTTTAWVRFAHRTGAGRSGFGVLDADRGEIRLHEGELFDRPRDTGERVALDAVTLLAPAQPSKVLALWNNFGQLAAKLNLARPAEPLYLIKPPNTYLDPGSTIRRPPGDGVKLMYEGELAIVIGALACRVPLPRAMEHVFGYTCANDVTLAGVVDRDPSFAQWVRAKGADTFCPFGPAIVSGLDPATLTVRTRLDGELRQDYPISDMRFSVAELVSMISHDMTLLPGDLILCGTSVGVGTMKPGTTVAVEIDGIGCLRNPVG